MRVTSPTLSSAGLLAQILTVDGSSSLLDADLLDGFGSGAFARSGANVDITSLAGTATNDSAAAGKIGEYLETEVLVGSAVSLTNNTAANVATLSLTAGDWDVWGIVSCTVGGTTTMTRFDAWIHTTSATSPGANNKGGFSRYSCTLTTGVNPTLPVGTHRRSLNATTTVYLSTIMLFGTSTSAAFGTICARRVR